MNGRSIQDIVPPARSKPLRPPPVRDQSYGSAPIPPQFNSEKPMNTEGSRNGTFLWIALGGLLVAGVVITLMSTVFHSARVSLTLAEWKTDVSGTYSAGDTVLPYTPLSVSADVSRTVPATGTINASDRASGTIVVSNVYSAKAQRLITNTRFETPEGKVYRIHAPISVPGYTVRNGAKVPGTVEAVVYADEPGSAYNLDSATFKLPGLKGTSQYELITATAQGPLSGGFVGTRATVEKSVRDQALAEIKSEIDRTLREKIATAAPPGSLVLPDSIDIRYVEKPDAASEANAVVSVIGTAFAPAFPSDLFAQSLAQRVAVASDSPLMVMNPHELQYAFISGVGSDGGPISFSIAGTAHLRASFNEQAFADDIAGKSRDAADDVRSSYRGIVGSPTITVRPFWLSTLPKNPERITIKLTGALDPTY